MWVGAVLLPTTIIVQCAYAAVGPTAALLRMFVINSSSCCSLALGHVAPGCEAQGGHTKQRHTCAYVRRMRRLCCGQQRSALEHNCCPTYLVPSMSSPCCRTSADCFGQQQMLDLHFQSNLSCPFGASASLCSAVGGGPDKLTRSSLEGGTGNVTRRALPTRPAGHSASASKQRSAKNVSVGRYVA